MEEEQEGRSPLTPLECVQQLNTSLQGAIRCVSSAASASYHTDIVPPPFSEGDVDQHVARFLDNAKGLDDFFSQIREREMQKSEVLLRKEISMLEREIEEKDACIEKYWDKAKQWEDSLRVLLEEHNAFEGQQRDGTPLFLEVPGTEDMVVSAPMDTLGL